MLKRHSGRVNNMMHAPAVSRRALMIAAAWLAPGGANGQGAVVGSHRDLDRGRSASMGPKSNRGDRRCGAEFDQGPILGRASARRHRKTPV